MKKIKWKTLGEICGIFKGEQLNKKDMLKIATYPVINGGTSPSGYIENYNQKENTITISQGGSAGYVNFIETKFWLGAHAFAVVPNDKFSKKYIYHFLKENQYKLENKKVGATIPNISKNDVQNFLISLPPLKKQAEIAETLDKFTELTEELTEELTAREAQYNYYRDMLLSEDYLNKISKTNDSSNNNQIRFTTLGEVAQINRGASPRPISNFLTDDESGIAWIKIGDIEANSKYVTKTVQKITFEGAQKSRILKKGDFIISNSMSYGRPYILKIDGAIHDGWASISNFENHLDSDFLYHFLNSSMVKNYWKRKINGSLVSNLNSEIICSLPIIIVDKKLQKKIAQKLDKFQSLLSNTQGLLPKEIKLRQKQYEYYREKLLTF